MAHFTPESAAGDKEPTGNANADTRHRRQTDRSTGAAPASMRRMALPDDPRLAWLLCGLLVLLLIGAVIWGFGQRDRADDARAANQTLADQLAQVRAGANATAYTLLPTGDGPADARGTAYFALTGSGMLQVAGLPALTTDQRYQLWYFPTADANPIPGGSFALDDQGIGFTLIPSDVGRFVSIGISREPAKGSRTPTGAMLVTGTVNGARG